MKLPGVFLGAYCVLVVFENVRSDCIWYGQCGHQDNEPDAKLNCLYKGPAFPLHNTTGRALLQKLCPQYAVGNMETCCDTNQLITLDSNFAVPRQLLSRCPSCFKNFINLFCAMTCDPNHSNFTGYWSLGGTKPYSGKSFVNANSSVSHAAYHVSSVFAEGLYKSCRNVQMPSNNQKAIAVLCGKSADQCNATNWLNFLGNKQINPATPFQIDITVGNTSISFDPFNPSEKLSPVEMPTVPCNESVSNDTLPCSCQDCVESCITPPSPPPPPKPFKLLQLPGYPVICAIVYATFFLLFTSTIVSYYICCQNSMSVNEDGLVILPKPAKHEPVIQDDIGCFERIGAGLEHCLNTLFNWWGCKCASNPFKVVLIALVLGLAFSLGMLIPTVPLTKPVELWSAPDSWARQQKNIFDTSFGPFYRTEQLIITPHNLSQWMYQHVYPYRQVYSPMGPVVRKDFLHQVLDLQLAIQNITVRMSNRTITLQDVCYKPLAPDNNHCTIQSPLQYFQNDHAMIDKETVEPHFNHTNADWISHLQSCTSNPTAIQDTSHLHTSCLAQSGQPVEPWVVLGGFNGTAYLNATAIVITFVVSNHVNDMDNEDAEAWEAEFIKYMKEYSNENFTVSFSAERSIEDEIATESAGDEKTVLISYLVMFVYISLALGQVHSLSRLFIDSKISLGMCGVVIVAVSVTSSLGIFSYFGVRTTLIVYEVVPFLVLAVGVDNIFILVQTYQRDIRGPLETREEQIGRIVGQIGPSMLLTSLSEMVAFFLGAMTSMPAVRSFSLYAGLAVIINFLFQISCLIGVMSWDAKRQEDSRLDVLCFVKGLRQPIPKQDGLLFYFVKNHYSHFLMKDYIRPVVMLVFVGWLCFCASLLYKVDVGLDQSLSMPRGSYVLDYFGNVSKYLSVGAPVYYVLKNPPDLSSRDGQNLVCGSIGCPQNSLASQIFTASQTKNISYIAQPASSWLDDYFDWIKPEGNPPCCRYHHNNPSDFCPSSFNDSWVTNDTCDSCNVQLTKSRPPPDKFFKYLPFFLKDNPGIVCTKGGHAAYGNAVVLKKKEKEVTGVGASYFMSYHVPCVTSSQFIAAMKSGRSIAENITKTMNQNKKSNQPSPEVFAYSVWYVYYEQYLTIIHDTIMNLVFCTVAIFIVTFFLLGCDLHSALMIIIVITMITVNMFGLMVLWNISLNAVSLVNLVMAVGISVEFCSHISRAFAVSVKENRVLRAKDALAHMGSSVLSGITLTKLGGIIVLAFSESQLFEVFYFRMYLGIVIFGASHGLIFLPVFLSYVGPSVNKAKLYRHQQERSRSGTLNRDESSPILSHSRSYNAL